jgi:uncharacterized protein YjbI with pentapeptide repeats
MTKQSLLKRLTQNVRQWNIWRQQHPKTFIDLSGATLSGATLNGANLSGADLGYTDLSRANLNGANLSGATLSYTDLSGATLSYTDLSRTILSYTNLSSANLSKAILSYTDLSKANLNGANLNYTDLSSANLSKAIFRGTDLNGANLSYTDLSGANLNGANLSYTNLSGANLNGANLSYTDLNGANLNGADLSYTDLNGANLSYTDLNGANLSYTDLSRADLSEADHNTAFSASDLHLSPPGSLIENALLFSTKEAEKARQPLQPLSVLYCYTLQDRKLRDQLETCLMVLKRLKQITLRLNREIPAGMDWKVVQDDRFHHADIILLLISPDFVASDYHYGIEMHHALEKHKAGNVWVIPILLRPTPYWQKTLLGTLAMLPQNGKAITDHQKRDQVLAEVVRRIGEVVSLLLLKKYPFLQAGGANKATQALGPFCVSCGARNPSEAPTCENCGDVLL